MLAEATAEVDWGAILASHSGYECVLDEATHQYTVNGDPFDSVTQILGYEGMLPDFSAANAEDVEHAAFRGTNIHLAAEFLDTGGLNWDSLTDEEVPFVQCWDTFKYDTGFQPHPDFIERCFASLSYRVAGRIDRAGLLRDDSPGVVDLKSGDIKPYTRIQLAGYGWLIDPTRIWQRFAVRLRANGKPQVEEYPVEGYVADVGVFLSAVCCTHWRFQHLGHKRRKG